MQTRLKVQLSVFVFLAAATLVVGPLLTKKRLFCGLICPFGAWQSFWGGLNPFRVSIWAGKCTQCGLCLKACPTFAISEAGLKEHRVEGSCSRCGECMQACPSGAIAYTLAGMPRHDVGMLFIFCALLVGGAVGGLFVPELLARFAQSAGKLLR